MNRDEQARIVAAVRQRYMVIAPYPTEQTRRVWAAAEAQTIDDNGNSIVAEATALSRTTIIKARRELDSTTRPSERQRRPGGGRQSLLAVDPTLLADLD